MNQQSRRKFRVVVLAGGASAEREVSLASGASVREALREAGHLPLVVDPLHVGLDEVDWQRFDGCFLSLHGGAGEDGRIQRELARRGVRFTGSDADASHAAMSKSTAKKHFERAGVLTPKHVLIFGPLGGSPQKFSDPVSRAACGRFIHSDFQQTRGEQARRLTVGAGLELPEGLDAVEKLGYPLVLKPDSQGSSLGVGLVRKAGELAESVLRCGRFGWPLLAEQYIAGREFTVSLLGRRPLPPLEITGCNEIFDYQSKYSGNTTEFHAPADPRPITLEKLQSAALRAAVALDTSGMVRVDLILDRDGQAWVLEVNTLPGMTTTSLAPKAARQIGWEMADLCDWMLRDAFGELDVT